MKYCTHCGEQLLDEAVVCPKCGCAADGSFDRHTHKKSWNTLSIIGFIISFFETIPGLVLSIIAYKQIQKSGEQGLGLAKAGIIISSVSLGISVLALLFSYSTYFIFFAYFLLLAGFGV